MARLRVAVTGRQGQVARSLVDRADNVAIEIILLGRPEFDLTRPETIADAIRAARPDVVVSAAAHTAVDLAESEPDAAFQTNEFGAGHVARAAASLMIPVVHLSTDYVFDGALGRPYREDDPTGPTGVYGRSKLAGEHAVAASNPDHAILRTAWVYSPFGKNFVRTMLTLAGTRPLLSVVGDQTGNPTSALDIADGVLAVARNLVDRRDESELRGVFHMTGDGSATWAEFATTIVEMSRKKGGPYAEIKAIPTAEYPTPAKRPANSQLSCDRLAQIHGVRLPHWHASVEHCIARLVPSQFARTD
jgi:dTDP-4-dehydrorhamnose reductase